MHKKLFAYMSILIIILTSSLTGCGRESATGESISPHAVESNSAVAQSEDVHQEAPPDNDWQFDAPENHGMDSAVFERLHAAIENVDIRAMLTVKDGFIIDEYYKDGFDENSLFSLRSCSKTFTGALIGLAIDNGAISGTDAKISEFFPQILDSSGAYKKEITIEHLLTHTSGLEWYEWGGNSSSWRPFRSAENWVDFVLSRNMTASPGTQFAYTTGGTHLLAAILQEATGQSAYEFGKEHVFSQMGMDSVKWSADPQGVTDGGNGISMTARDAAKFGQLYLDGGKWRGRQILPVDWVSISTQRRIEGADGRSAYGYQWWVRSFAYETWYAMGHGGQFIFVVPELNLVTVVTSQMSDTYAPRAYFSDYVLEAYVG